MKTLEYRIRFNTPAFLGNANQSGQWRTPPFKALLRQWWRVAYAAEKQFNVNISEMRKEEGILFGHAWLEDDRDDRDNKIAARKSQVRIRLGNTQGNGEGWTIGTQQGVQPLSDGLDTSYAWFGLIKRGNGLPNRTGIKAGQAESVRQLHLAVPKEQENRMQEVISLIHAFGLLGSRSRGGWGALHVENSGDLRKEALQKYARELVACLNDEWAMSLAKDNKGFLVWEGTNNFDSWDKAMKFIATQRKTVRTVLKNGKDLRPALGFALPDGRMPSPLRWKIMAPEQGKLMVRIFSMPHKIPDGAGKNLSIQDLQSSWNTVARTLDGIQTLQRLK